MDDNLFGMLDSLDDTPQVRDQYCRAPFMYMGSKFASLEHILPRLPYRSRYVEPFGGSGIVLINRKQSRLEVFNDRYAGVVAFYRCLRDSQKTDALIQRLELTVWSREEFIWSRDTWKDVKDDVERAARWYYMMQMSFLGKGQAFGRVLSGNWSPPLRTKLPIFPAIHSRFKDVLVENQDWKQCIRDFDDSDSVFYLDPPYMETDSGVYEHKFSKQDHISMLETIQQMKGFVALSGYPNALYNSYKWDYVHVWEVCRKGIGFAASDTNNQPKEERFRGTVQECLWVRE